MDKYYIKTEDWEKIYTFLKTLKDIRVGNVEKIRIFTEAVYFIMRTGRELNELKLKGIFVVEGLGGEEQFTD